MPTILEYAGVEYPDAGQSPGRSFVPILKGEKYEEPEDVVVYDEYGPARMIRSREWKLVCRIPDGPHELYNMKDDPGERNNLYEEKEHVDLVRDMKSRMDSWFAQYTDPRFDKAREFVTGWGQTGWADQERTEEVPFFSPQM
jgi:arylsulfatase A-like enzyme